ncbi:MAG TPA: MFS transporter [Steroidobacteraceae bacterium]
MATHLSTGELNTEPVTGAPGAQTPAEEKPWPSRGRAWYAVFMFALVLCVNFLDRGILPLLVVPIKRDLGLTDTQISLLMGFAFVMFYVILGLPIARLVDRSSRRRIMAIGVALWSGATALCGLANTFVQLFLARVGVGVGEACVGPATYSMLADLFPREQLARAVSVLNFGFIAGIGLSAIMGGAVIGALEHLPPVVLPFIGVLRSWQLTFLVVGIPGLLVALLMGTVVEPVRRDLAAAGVGAVAGGRSIPIRDVVRYLWTNRAVYGPMYGALALQSIPSQGAISWGPTFFIRVHHWTPRHVGLAFGTVVLLVAPFALMAGGLLAERLMKRGYNDANLRVQLLAICLWIPGAALMPMMPTPTLALTAFGVSLFFAMMAPGPQNAALQSVTPNRMRGQATALFLFVFNIVGFGCGPTVIALITDFVFHDDTRVGSALTLATAILGPLSAWALFLGLKPYGRLIAATAGKH